MGSGVEVTSCSKDKREKNEFYMECFYDRLHLNFQITKMAFMGLHFEADKPRMNIFIPEN